MWLLNTRTLELHEFLLEMILDGYAILSHVWNKKEDTWRDIVGLAGLPVDERWSRISQKTKNCCKFAAENGFEWESRVSPEGNVYYCETFKVHYSIFNTLIVDSHMP